MALEKRDASIPFGAAGIDTETDPKLVKPGNHLRVENGVYTKDGSIILRNGYEQIINTNGISRPQKIAALDNELVLLGQEKIYGYSPQTDSWIEKGSFSNVTAESQTILRDARDVKDCQIAQAGGIQVLFASVYQVTTLSYSLTVVVQDAATGKVFKQEYIAATLPYNLKAIALGTKIYLYYLDGSAFGVGTNNILVSIIDTATPATIPAFVAASSAGLIWQTFDICVNGATLSAVYSTNTLSALAPINTTTGVIGTGVTITSAGSVAAVGICSDGTTVYGFAGLRAVTADPTTLVIATNQAWAIPSPWDKVFSYSCIATSGTCQVMRTIYDDASTYDFPYAIENARLTSGGTLTISSQQMQNFLLSSKPFLSNNLAHVVVMTINYDSALDVSQQTAMVCRLELVGASYALRPVTFLPKYVHSIQGEPGTATLFSNDGYYAVSEMLTLETDTYATVLNSIFRATIFSESLDAATFYTFKVADKNALAATVVNDALYISSGLLFSYDGSLAVEVGYLVYPLLITLAQPSAGQIANGTYFYTTVYEWVDRVGQVHISAPSNQFSITVTGGPKNVEIQSRCTPATYKGVPSSRSRAIGVMAYRTEASGTIFYRSLDGSIELENNTQTIPTVTQIETGLGTALNTHPILYTTGGILENIHPGTSKHICQYRGRLVLSGLETKDEINPSKLIEPGLAVQFNDTLTLAVQGERITASMDMDEKLIIFKENSIFLQSGNGPTNTGQNSDFTNTPIAIATDVGCVAPKTIVKTPLGLMFFSAKGFYLLSRGLAVDYNFGNPVRRFSSLDFREGVLLEDRTEVRWVSSDGECVVYNYQQNKWSTFSNISGVSCCLWGGRFTVLKSDGTIWAESPTSYLDNGTAVTMKVTTPWYALAGLQHAQRLYRLLINGQLHSENILTCKWSYDYEPATRETFIFNSDAVLGDVSIPDSEYYVDGPSYTGQDRTYTVEMRPKIQKCEAFRLEINVTPNVVSSVPVDGACVDLTGLTGIVGGKASTLRPKANRRPSPVVP
jgi:hypothetical protein